MPEECKVKNCNNNTLYKSGLLKKYCRKHRLQMIRHGKILQRTSYNKNKIVIKKNICEMEIYDRKNIIIAKTIFDINLLERIKKHKWCLSHGYPVTRKDKKIIYLHHLVIGRKKGLVIDHINMNPLDNRKDNLRHIEHKKNLINTKSKNIYFDKSMNKWTAKVMIDGKSNWLGGFVKKMDALLAVKRFKINYLSI